MIRDSRDAVLPPHVRMDYARDMRMEILSVGPYEVNCLVLWNDPEQAWIIDPGADAPTILDVLKRRNLRPAQVVCTHGHIDHLSALGALLAVHSVSVFMHGDDAKWAFMPHNRLPPDYPEMVHRPAMLQTIQHDGQLLAAGGLEARVVLTPGHTPGGICLDFRQEGILITGDTLFAGSVGRTDFPGGDSRRLGLSLARLLEWPDTTRVIPGHGPATTIGEERAENPCLRQRG